MSTFPLEANFPGVMQENNERQASFTTDDRLITCEGILLYPANFTTEKRD